MRLLQLYVRKRILWRGLLLKADKVAGSMFHTKEANTA